jgi:tryptophanyl-tRNA synthetase
MARVLSGIKPTGFAQLGNYLGALRYWVQDQHETDAFFCVVDLHALTVEHDPKEVRALTLHQAQILVASGLDPDVCTIFVQSHVPEHVELSWLMESTAYFGELRRMIQFKEKSAGSESVRASLFTYPALMAADILLYQADRVPVGDDQRQHLELTRDLAMRFNAKYGDTFTVPEATVPKVGARIMELQDPTAKMGKTNESTQSNVFILDEPSVIEKKIKRAVTDTETEVRYDPESKPGVSNLLEILGAATDRVPVELAAEFKTSSALKAATAEAVIEALRPVQSRYAELAADPAGTAAVLEKGAAKARSVASITVARAKEAIGLLPA